LDNVFVIFQGFNHHGDDVIDSHFLRFVVLKLLLIVDGAEQ